MSAEAPADKPAYDFALCIALRPSLYGYACKLTRDKDAAQDLVQDALEKALKAWHRFEPKPDVELKRAVSAWLHQIVHNEFVKTWRHARVRKHISLSEAPPFQPWGTDGKAATGECGADGMGTGRYLSPFDRASGAGTAIDGLGDELEAAISDLLPQQIKILMRVYARDGQYHEVARELGIPIGTVMSSLNRARNRLIARLGKWAAAEYGITDQRRGATP